MKGAFLHMAVDAAGSVAAIVAAVAVLVWNADRTDPVVSIGVAGRVVWSAWSLQRDTTNVMLEAAPGDVDLEAVEAALRADDAVSGVHHTHVWSLASDVTAFSGHVVLDAGSSLHDAQIESDRLKSMLAARFRIDHATLEVECHSCAVDEDIRIDDHSH
jgi:cobalt-zinc-cadmium efflux system protein